MGKKTKVGKTRKDKFYKLAKETGFRSRAAFKLIQLNKKFGFLQESQVCIDLCAAPGGWMQVAKQNMPVSSIVVGVDLFPIRSIPGCIGLVEDITTDKCKTSLSRELKTWKADVVLHDGAPNVGKNWLFDAYQQICLTLNSLKLATHFLRNGGWFVTKVFRSKDYNALLWVLKQLFRKIHATKPSASRKESAEIFVVCQGYFAPDKIDPKLLDPRYVFEELDLEGKKNNSLLHPDKQKRIKAEGYTEQDVAGRNDLSATEFMKSMSGLSALQGIGSITIDHDGIRNHPRTTTEILECCKDIKVLGRKDIKGLLLWWKHIKGDLFKEPENETAVVEEEPDKKPLTIEEIEEMEGEELEKKVAELADEEQKDLKKKRKKTLKARTKLNEKMNLNMIIKGDEGPVEQFEQDIFDLKAIKTRDELENMQDISPDFVIDDEVEVDKVPKFKKYDKDSPHLDDDGLYDDGAETEEDESSDDDLGKDGLGLSDDEQTDVKSKNKKNKKSGKTDKPEDHPLIKSGDFRDKDTRRQQRVQMWFEKETLQNVDSDDDEDVDLDYLAEDYKTRGVEVLGQKKPEKMSDFGNTGTNTGGSLGKRAKGRAKYAEGKESSSESSDSEEEVDEKNVAADDVSKEPKPKKLRLNEEELAIGALMIKGKKTKRDLVDDAWNRYVFNDQNLPHWFVTEEDQHMRKPVPVPKELIDEYESKVRELNVRPIKKVMEAKARKKRRALKRMAKAKKNAEKILENGEASSQEKMRQLKKIYKKTEEKKKEISYVVAKKHLSSKRARRPAGVKGRFRVVDPRQKKDKRSIAAKDKRSGKKRK